jgi:hypothetical protein
VDVLRTDLTKTSASADDVDACHSLDRDGWKSWRKRFQNPAVNAAKAAKEAGMKLNLWRTICLVCVFCVLTKRIVSEVLSRMDIEGVSGERNLAR